MADITVTGSEGVHLVTQELRDKGKAKLTH